MRFEIDKIDTSGRVEKTYKVHEMSVDPDVARSYLAGALEANRMNHRYMGTEHLLLGMLSEPSALEIFSGLITTQGENGTLTLDWAREETNRIIERGPRPVSLSKLSLTPRATKVIDAGFETVKQLGLRSINMSVQTLALLDEIDGTSAQILGNLCVNYDAFRRDLQRRVFGS